MSIRRQVFLALAVVSAAVIIQSGPATAAPPPGTPALRAPDGPAITEIPLDSPEVAAVSPESVGKPIPNSAAGRIPAQSLPHGIEGDQLHFTPNPEQWDNARTIVEVVRHRGMPDYAAVVALATALQESMLRNLTEAVDYDSLGVFQQRPSAGWGTPEQITDLRYATERFLDALLVHAPNYQAMPLWQAAQAAQRSGFPRAYARWQDQAAQMVLQLLGQAQGPAQRTAYAASAQAVLECC
ncbi:hypothetical protein ACQP1G_35745 [Nocardia sp. CA-107356]|uniref:hypothetical protein n=1 Tax=Nocardia sp. CA-107356 TaxID=3239972 RepID=UPI003D8ACD3B